MPYKHDLKIHAGPLLTGIKPVLHRIIRSIFRLLYQLHSLLCAFKKKAETACLKDKKGIQEFGMIRFASQV